MVPLRGRMTSASRHNETSHPEDYLDWLRALRAAERRRAENGEPDWLSREQRMRAEQKERGRAADPETKAFIKREPGRLTDGLVNAAVWQTHLFPGKTRPSLLDDVVDELLTSPVDAVRALVGESSRKTLRDRLIESQCILEPDQSALTYAAEWAEREGLPALLPLEALKLADGGVQRMGGSCRVGRRLVLVGVCPKPVAQP